MTCFTLFPCTMYYHGRYIPLFRFIPSNGKSSIRTRSLPLKGEGFFSADSRPIYIATEESDFAEDHITMNLLLTIKSLYAVNGVIAVLLYLPQINNAWKDRDHALSLSLVSFGGWSFGSLITALYAWIFVKDSMFTAISLGNMAGSGAVFLIVLCSRFNAGRSSSPD